MSLRFSIAAFTAGLILLFSSLSGASEVCAPLLGQTPQHENCERLVRDKKIPKASLRALTYTVKYWAQNRGGLKNPECAIRGMDARELYRWKSEANIKKGIENDCSFILNDVTNKWPGHKSRSTAFFVDLCATNPSQLVSKFYVNIGNSKLGDDSPDRVKGSKNSKDWNKSTLAGAFLLQGKFRDEVPFFTATRPKKYADILSRAHGKVPKGRLPTIDLIGLNSSNNTTESLKPFHVTNPDYKSSFGCIGVNESTFPIMEKAVSDGSSLMMSYAGPQFEEKGSCDNDRSDSGVYQNIGAGSTAPAGSSKPGAQ